jgi:hypothetical protein
VLLCAENNIDLDKGQTKKEKVLNKQINSWIRAGYFIIAFEESLC